MVSAAVEVVVGSASVVVVVAGGFVVEVSSAPTSPVPHAATVNATAVSEIIVVRLMGLLGFPSYIRLWPSFGSAGWQNEDVDPDVLARFRDGDEQAVKAIYERYSGAVYALSMRVLRDHGRAADATQQTFVKAWRSARNYDESRPIAPWLFAIARRTAIDIYRKEKRRFPSDDLLIAEDGPSMESIWEVFEVRAALDLLSDEERAVIRMSHFDGLTHVEISQRLDIPLGTVKSRSHRAHSRLVEILGHLTHPGEPNPDAMRKGDM